MLCGPIGDFLGRIISLLAILVSSHKIYHDTDIASSELSHNPPEQLNLDPVSNSQIQNATLGFQKILVLNAAKRVNSRSGILLAAAESNVTLEFQDNSPAETPPPSSHPSQLPQELRRSVQEPSPVWMQRTTHARAIRHIISQRLSSALILESHADWDVTIHDQLTSFATAARSTLHRYLGDTHTRTVESPYGIDWDVLWLGHCGGTSPPPSLRTHQTLILDDKSMPPVFASTGLCPTSPDADLDEKTCLVPKERIVEIGASPNCTTAYALSANGAAKLLLLLDEGYISSDAEFREALKEFCGKAGSCLSVSPPYFVRHKAKGRVRGDAVEGEPGFESGFRDVGVSRGVVHSARMYGVSGGVSQYVEDRSGWRYKRASEYPGARVRVEDTVDSGHAWKGRMRAKSAKFVAEEI